MTEIKNTFIKSKMNRDLDDRLVPNGEYREAINVNISASEGDGVGSLETSLGNVLITDFSHTADCRVKINGYLVDELNNTIYVFLTDFIDTSIDKLSFYAPSASVCEIWSYNFQNNNAVKLVEGNFLNFSLTHPILGVNIVESLLFWTDDRNQPRKINVNAANPNNLTSPTFYTNEDQISVAKYYPHESISLFYDYVTSFTLTTNGGSGDPLNPNSYVVANGLPTTGGTGVGLTVNVTAKTSDGGISTLEIANEGVGYSNGDVLTIAPRTGNATITLVVTQESTMRDKCSEFLPYTVVGKIDAASAGTTIVLDDNFGYTPVAGWKVTAPEFPEDSYGLVANILSANSFDIQYPASSGGAVDPPPTSWVTGVDLTFSAPNPDYDSTWPGDCEYLKDKFVRFSYRFKFIDNEYSLIAPFTQECFVPKQDGYVLLNDEDKAVDTSELTFFENKINDIDLVIPCPLASYNLIYDNMHISSIEILYKESGQQNIKVVDEIDRNVFIANTTNKLIYNYQSRAPYKTLRSSEITRVSDVVPIRARAQEITGNRVVYGNFINKHSSLQTLDYQVGIGDKTNATDEPFQKEYQNHSLKQNRTYQVGVVLSDRYGRQSDVILSALDDETNIDGGVSFSGSTIYNALKPDGFDETMISSTTTWPGDSLFLQFNSVIPSVSSVKNYPGLYIDMNANPVSSLFPGGGYASATGVATTTAGSGVGLTVDIVNCNCGAGFLEQVTINNAGSGYSNGDVITIVGGITSATFIYTPTTQPNITGWYSYKIVVKQQEQEYYNAYLPSILNGVLDTTTTNSNTRANISLFSDNINKVPKDLANVGPTQNVFNASEVLLFRVNNIKSGTTSVNKQYYPTLPGDNVVQIGTMSDLGFSRPESVQLQPTSGAGPTSVIAFGPLDENQEAEEVIKVGDLVTAVDSSGVAVSGLEAKDGVYVVGFYATGAAGSQMRVSEDITYTATDMFTISAPNVFYNSSNNPYIGVLNTSASLGTRIGNTFTNQLTVAETEPVFSDLDIYWETSTSGLVSVLNNSILTDSADVANGITYISYSQNEGMAIGAIVTNAFQPKTVANVPITDVNATGILLSVIDGNQQDRTNDFILDTVGNGTFTIKTNTFFYCGSDAAALTFTFNVEISTGGTTLTTSFNGVCDNIPPTWGDVVTAITFVNDNSFPIIKELTNCNNGSASSNLDTEELTWEIKKATYISGSYIGPTPPQPNTIIYPTVNSVATSISDIFYYGQQLFFQNGPSVQQLPPLPPNPGPQDYFYFINGVVQSDGKENLKVLPYFQPSGLTGSYVVDYEFALKDGAGGETIYPIRITQTN